MFLNLPWFIRKKIIWYLIIDDSQFCLLNREWFAYSAEQFMIIYSSKLCTKYPSSRWLTFAGKFYFTEDKDLDWEFLNNCHRIKLARFTLYHNRNYNFQLLRTFVSSSPLKSVYFNFGCQEMKYLSLDLLKEISQQLQTLELYIPSFRISFLKLLQLKYSKVINFKVHATLGSIHFESIYQNMPNIEYMTLNIHDIIFHKLIIERCNFFRLKELEITLNDKNWFDRTWMLNNLFQYHFPILTMCKLNVPFEDNSIGLISQSMPKLKKLHLSIFSKGNIGLSFPIFPLLHLEELILDCKDKENIISCELDLYKVPKVVDLKIGMELKLFTSNISQRSLISCLKINYFISTSYQHLCDQLPNLNEISINGLFYNLFDVLDLCKRVSKVSIYNIKYLDRPDYLPLGPFKTTHLELAGENFLSYELLNWIANQPQLTHLQLNYQAFSKLNLDKVYFNNLHQLNLVCQFKQVETYLKSRLIL